MDTRGSASISEAAAAARAVSRLRDLRKGPAAIADILSCGAEAVPALEALLVGPTESVAQPRCLAADVLGAVPGEAALETLLVALANSAGRRLPPVLREAEDAVGNRIARCLADRRDPRIPDALVSALLRRPLVECAAGLGRWRSLQAIPALIGRLGDDFAGEAAADALVRIGAPSVPALCRLLTADEEGNGRPQAFAVEVLGRIGGPAVHVALRSVLEDSDPAVRLGAALGLSRLQPGSARNVLGILLESLPDAGPATREEILHAISRLGSEAESLLLEVLREAGSPVRSPVRGVVEAVGHIRTPHAVADLTRLAEDPDSRLRLAAVTSLGMIPGPAPVWGLSRFLRDSDACVRIAAARGLGIRGSPGGRALAGALGDPEPAVRRVAEREILALGRAALPGLRSAMVASRRESWLSLGRWRHLKSARRLLRLIERLHLEAAPHADRPGETRRGDATSAIRPKVP